MKNLIRLYRAGLPCPQPLMQKDHVLLMSFIGKRGWPAPQLRVRPPHTCFCRHKMHTHAHMLLRPSPPLPLAPQAVKLSPPRLARCYRQTLRIVHGMYHRARLVHADLSEFNLLLHRGRTWVIDVGQAVERRHPDADRLLRNDVANMSAFFAKRGLPTRDPEPEAEHSGGQAAGEGAEATDRDGDEEYDDEEEEEEERAMEHTKPDCGPCAVVSVDAAVEWVLTEFPTDAARDEAMEEVRWCSCPLCPGADAPARPQLIAL